jgi:glycosyltransferase involved in cell wall biosynthesis
MPLLYSPAVPRRSVLQVVQPPDGGVAEHVLWLASGLVARGWDVAVATGPDSRIAEPLARAGVEVHVLPLRRAPGPGDLAAARALRALDRRLAPDIVHAHSSKAGLLVRGALPRPSRTVYTPNCLAFLTREGRGRQALYRAVEQALVPRSGAIIAVCDWERSETQRALRGSATRLHMVHNGVPDAAPQEPDPRMTAFAEGRPLAGLVAVLRAQKDPLLLVQAAARMAPESGRVAIVGGGPLRDAVAREIDRLGVSDRIGLFGYSGSMGPHLAALDALVLPSAWEAFPIAILEAMQAGLPIVATSVGGVPEAVQDGVSGRLVPAGDADALASALSEVLSDPGARARMGAAGAAMVRQRFALEPMIDATVAIYDTLAGGGRK